MSIEVLLVQVLVLAFTGVLWWIARRDLAARRVPPAAPPAPADTADLEQLCATLETLVTSLARRLDAVERRIEQRPAAPRETHENAVPVTHPEPAMSLAPAASPAPAAPAELVPDPRYAPVYALLRSGVSDPVEIARQTGLGRGEVDLILSLRDRRAF